MKFNIVNGSITIGDKVIKLNEDDIIRHWRPWQPILDEDSNDAVIRDEFDEKQYALAILRRNKEKVLPKIFHSTYDEYSHFVHRVTGKAFHYNNRDCRKDVRGNKIYLIKWDTDEEKLVFDGKNFIPTVGGWLMANKQPLSKNGCKGVLYTPNDMRYSKLPIKNHQLIAALFFGQHAIDTAIDGENEINHRNLNNDDNRPENLEIGSKLENKRHARIMRKVLIEKANDYLKSLDDDFESEVYF